jgi:hypothetical protein
MSEGTVRQWCRMFKDGQTDVHNEERSGRPSVVSDDLVQSIDKKFVKDDASQFQNFRVNFHKFHTLFCTRLPQSGCAITRFAQDRFRKCSWVCTERREWLQL